MWAEAYLAKARYYRNMRKYPEALQTCDEAIVVFTLTTNAYPHCVN